MVLLLALKSACSHQNLEDHVSAGPNLGWLGFRDEKRGMGMTVDPLAHRNRWQHGGFPIHPSNVGQTFQPPLPPTLPPRPRAMRFLLVAFWTSTLVREKPVIETRAFWFSSWEATFQEFPDSGAVPLGDASSDGFGSNPGAK